MRILIISQYFPPENALYVSALAKHLGEQGHSVRVVTSYPNYPKGELFDGYSQRWRSYEDGDFFRVLRVPMFIDHSESAVRRSLNFASFGVSAATARKFARGADVVYVYATQMTAAFGPWLWRIAGGAPYVLHVQDLWPDSITGSSLVGRGRSARFVEGALTPWLSSVYRRAAGVIGIAPTMVETLAQRGVDRDKLHLIYNWAADSFSADALLTQTPDETRTGGVTILYAGNVGDMQDLEVAVKAAYESRGSGVRLRILGDGVALPRIKALAERLGSENVEFLGRVPREEVGGYYRDADFALVTLKNLPAFRGTIPSKFQSSLANGLPVITSVQGDVRSIVEETESGFTADCESVDSLTRAFRRAADSPIEVRRQMADRARSTYAERFSQSTSINMIEDVLLQAAQGQG